MIRMHMENRTTRLIQIKPGDFQIHAPAKLNLGLRVFPPRPDGFHPVETWMAAISWHDTLHVEAAPTLELLITGRAEGIPTEPAKNLVGKAALALAAHANRPATARITLHKSVPPGGGMGGGSSDAANTLLALNALWNLNLSDDTLEQIASALGSDVPFFIRQTAALCTGRGEIMTPLRGQGGGQPLFAVLILPPNGCPTKDVYQAFDAGHQHTPPKEKTDWQKCAAAPADQLAGLLVNDLEPPAFHVAPWLKDLCDRAAAIISAKVHMTGSGSTLFTLCSSGAAADTLAKKLQAALPAENACLPVRIFT
jgi:4-diphosphocytidyl-2-C-methyl-D-erythritol kinase